MVIDRAATKAGTMTDTKFTKRGREESQATGYRWRRILRTCSAEIARNTTTNIPPRFNFHPGTKAEP